MRTWEYCEPGPHGEDITVRITDEQILAKYWDFVCAKAKEQHKLISSEDCILDFVTIHWAHEVKGDK